MIIMVIGTNYDACMHGNYLSTTHLTSYGSMYRVRVLSVCSLVRADNTTSTLLGTLRSRTPNSIGSVIVSKCPAFTNALESVVQSVKSQQIQ